MAGSWFGLNGLRSEGCVISCPLKLPDPGIDGFVPCCSGPSCSRVTGQRVSESLTLRSRTCLPGSADLLWIVPVFAPTRMHTVIRSDSRHQHGVMPNRRADARCSAPGPAFENHLAILRPDAPVVKAPLNRHRAGELQSNRLGQYPAAFLNRGQQRGVSDCRNQRERDRQVRTQQRAHCDCQGPGLDQRGLAGGYYGRGGKSFRVR